MKQTCITITSFALNRSRFKNKIRWFTSHSLRKSRQLCVNMSRADVNLLSLLSAVAVFPFRTSCSQTQTRDTASSSLPSTISRLCKTINLLLWYPISKKKRKKKKKWRRGSSKAAHLPFAISIWLWGFEYFWWFFLFSFFFAPPPFYMQKHIFGSTRDVIRYITTQMCDMKKNTVFLRNGIFV